MEQKIRSVVKSVSWRLVATLNGFLVAFVLLNDFKQSMKISVIANISGMLLYYFHERIWNNINWKRK